MFENVLYQNATNLLKFDIEKNNLPQSVLFAGPEASGKLTAALETARILSCTGVKRGDWNCTCPSCLKQKALIDHNLLIAGSSTRTLEIKAAKNTFLTQYLNNSDHLNASRYLYVRAVRKLTLRFSEVLWEGDDKLSKFSPLLQSVSENLELLNPGKKLPEDQKELEKILESIEADVQKLEASYLYESLPVSQVRKISYWVHLTSSSKVKVVIIENAEKMQDSARNALLKTLEEPPENTHFILLTQNRQAILPTILSRVRTYTFVQRTEAQEKEVIDRVFHNVSVFTKGELSGIKAFLRNFLSVSMETVSSCASDFLKNVFEGHVPDIKKIFSYCNSFKPDEIMKIFLEELIKKLKSLLDTPEGTETAGRICAAVRKTYNDFSVFNQNPEAALENLSRLLLQVNYNADGILRNYTEKL